MKLAAEAAVRRTECDCRLFMKLGVLVARLAIGGGLAATNLANPVRAGSGGVEVGGGVFLVTPKNRRPDDMMVRFGVDLVTLTSPLLIIMLGTTSTIFGSQPS
jgi:hypothetical protein